VHNKFMAGNIESVEETCKAIAILYFEGRQLESDF
jgi:hypothetical protein